MNISKKLISYILIGFLCVSSCSITYYKSVHAFEWVTGGIATAEALKWLLGALGIIGTGVAFNDQLQYWADKEDEFYDYVDENTEIYGPDLREWMGKLGKGVLDKSSFCWDAFKSWASTLASSNSGGSDLSGSNDFTNIYSKLCIACGVNPVSNIDLSYLSNNYTCYAATGSYNYPGDPLTITFYLTDKSYIFNSARDIVASDNSNYQCSWNFYNRNFGSSRVTSLSSNSIYSGSSVVAYWGNIDFTNAAWFHNVVNVTDSGGDSSLSSIDDARQEQFDLINRFTGNEVENEVAIPMPGVDSGDDTISQDVYQGIIDRVNEGEITTDQAVEEIQEIMKVIVYDTETDDVIPISPDPDDPNENQKKDDVLKEEKENMGFTLAGLENVFPFCIPWDIYAFLNILDAEPVAPVFNIPFPNVDDPEHPLTTQVDLSSWDDAMRIVRLAQDFLFIIGLAFLTRSMIGAGGGD